MQFKIFATLLLALLPTTFALPEPVNKEAVAIAAPVSGRDEPGSLVQRACSYTTGCRSNPSAKPGKYCGFCIQVTVHWDPNHIYQSNYPLWSTAETRTKVYRVNGGSGASSCCDYGYSSVCAARYAIIQPDVYVQCATNSRGY